MGIDIAAERKRKATEKIINYEKADISSSTNLKKKKIISSWLLLLSFSVIAFVIIDPIPDKKLPTHGISYKKDAKKISPTAAAISNITFDWEWSTAGSGSFLEISFTATNKNTRSIKDIEITCIASGKSGTVIDLNKRTIYDIIPPGGELKLEYFSMGLLNSQTFSENCSVSNLVLF